jgi:3',5'-cyclic AMP phosphodiesterase CpdA
MFLLAHLSDPHVPSRLHLRVQDLLSKRLLGYLSWTMKRRHLHRTHALDAITEDVRAQRPDQIVVTGDIVNLALPSEFAAAADWLSRLGPAHQVTVIPGNHDTYVDEPWDQTLGLWQAHMTSDEEAWRGSGSSAHPFPFVRRRGPIALVGLSTAVPTAPGLATGVLGKRQLHAARDLLLQLGKEDLLRVVLVHHPPSLDQHDRHRKRLTDAEAFRAIIAEVGAELILHGHTHRYSLTEITGFDGAVAVIGTPSASMTTHPRKEPSQYHLYQIEPSRHGWELTVRVRRMGSAIGRFSTVGEHRVLLRRSRGDVASLALREGGRGR